MQSDFISNIVYKIIYELKDNLLKLYWKAVLRKRGEGSYIRSHVRVIGNLHRFRIGNNFKVYENCIITIGKAALEIGDNGLSGVGSYINFGQGKIKSGITCL